MLLIASLIKKNMTKLIGHGLILELQQFNVTRGLAEESMNFQLLGTLDMDEGEFFGYWML